jgi:protease-4
VFASGDIISGEGGVDIITGSRFIGSETMVKALRTVREDKSVKAVVLRVDSPGGFALASDMIWREVNRLRESDKPLVVSVGDLAASGGYYLACPGDSIIANPGAVVGSIGIFGGKLALDSLYHKLGLDFAVLKRGENADIYSSARRFTPEQRAKMQDDVEQGYAIFVERVAQGRGMTAAEVDSVGQGRMYSGERGIDRGLVDRTGGLEDALQTAMHMAGIADEAEVVSYPGRLTFWEALARQGATGAWRWEAPEGRLFYDPVAAMLRH